MAAETHLAVLPVAPVVRPAEYERLVRRARLLAWFGLGWHAVEAAVAIGAGAVAGSIALVGFGADSLIEAAAGVVVLWLMTGDRASSQRAARRRPSAATAAGLMAVAPGAWAAHTSHVTPPSSNEGRANG